MMILTHLHFDHVFPAFGDDREQQPAQPIASSVYAWPGRGCCRGTTPRSSSPGPLRPGSGLDDRGKGGPPRDSEAAEGEDFGYPCRMTAAIDTSTDSGPPGQRLRVYATCPQSKDWEAAQYGARVADVARRSEQAGCEGILVYVDNGIVDPWLVAERVISATERLRPLVAVQPVYMHPYSVAKMIASLAFIHGRAVDLNMLAGGFKNDLLALGDTTEHDDRYERTVEYTQIVTGLLAGETVTVEGRWHTTKNLSLTPELPEALRPRLMISGSSEAGRKASQRIGALPIRYPEPVEEERSDSQDAPSGVRVGIITRGSDEEAWRVASDRFPEDRAGEVKHQLAMKVSDSDWHRELSAREPGGRGSGSAYWLGPFGRGQTFCPYLVGSYERVGRELARYLATGVGTFVLDIPPDPDELGHAGEALASAGADRG